MHKVIKCKISGLTPMLMHNGRLANPIDPIVRAIKEFSGKRNKTDDDHEQISRLEFLGGLYLGEDGAPCVTGESLEGMLVEGAKKAKKGRKLKAAISCGETWPLIYDGPKQPDALWQDKRFVDVRSVGVQRVKVMRTRPIFKSWALKFEVEYLPSVVNPGDVKTALEVAALEVGLSDYRPRFGKFVVDRFEV